MNTRKAQDHYPEMFVMIKGERVYNNDPDLKVLEIEEDIQGRDVLTVEYHGERYRSLVRRA